MSDYQHGKTYVYDATTQTFDESASAELAKQLQQTFEIQWTADQRAIKMWQDAHPGNDHIWPDRCNMVVWLLNELDKLRAPKDKLVTVDGTTFKASDVELMQWLPRTQYVNGSGDAKLRITLKNGMVVTVTHLPQYLGGTDAYAIEREIIAIIEAKGSTK